MKFSFERYRGVAHDLMQARVAEVETPDAAARPLQVEEAVAGFPDLLRHGHRRRLDRAEEICREGRRGGLQEGADRRRARTSSSRSSPASSWSWRRSSGTGARRRRSSASSSRSIPDEATRLAALKRRRDRHRLFGPRRTGRGAAGAPRASRSSRPWCRRRSASISPTSGTPNRRGTIVRVRQAASLAIDRKSINEALTLGYSQVTQQHRPRQASISTGSRRRRYTIRPRRSSCWPRRASPTASMPAVLHATPRTPISARPSSTTSLAVGIRGKLRPIERAAFIKEYHREESTRTSSRRASGAFGNAATRLEAFVVKGGAFVYGSYPDIDALYQQQAGELDR